MADLKIGRIVLGMCQTNCYFVYKDDEEGQGERSVIVFDPGDKGEYVYSKLKEKGFCPAAILLTHGHFDHIWGVEELQKLSGAKLYAYEEEKDVCESASVNVSRGAGRPCTVTADVYLKDGEEITIAGMTCKLLATPGHTKGSCCYYFEDNKILISGDTLFQESVGRTDLPTGSMGVLVRSVKEKLLPLPDGVKVYPGHGEATTIGHEKQYNPFL